MAPKTKSRLVDQPPSASSSEEHQHQQEVEEEEEESQEEEEQSEEEGEEEVESGEETEEDEPKTVEKKPVQTPQKPLSSSESGTENGSGSESESDSGHSGQSLPSPSASDFTVKPSVPAKAAAAAAAPSKPAPPKRPPPQETQKEKDSRRKKPKIAEEEEKKSAATPRSLWSEDDQLALLKGMVEYKAQKGTEPNADMSAFYEFMKGKLQADVSKSQLSDKLRRLKKKFVTNVKDGEDPVFLKSQDALVFEYSKRIWGAPSSNVVKETVNNSTNGKAKKAIVAVKKSAEPKKSAKVSTFTKAKDDEKRKEEDKEKQVAVKEVVKEDIVKGGQQDFQLNYPRLATSLESMGGMSLIYPNGTSWLKENMGLVASDKAKVLEEKWKKLHDEEATLMLKRLDLIREHYGLVVDAKRGN